MLSALQMKVCPNTSDNKGCCVSGHGNKKDIYFIHCMAGCLSEQEHDLSLQKSYYVGSQCVGTQRTTIEVVVTLFVPAAVLPF